MSKAILYARFSNRPGAAECQSIITQFDRLRSYCAASDWEVLAERDDADKTGATTEGRPGLEEALVLACKHKAALVVYSLSRLARSTRDAINIMERLGDCGADLVSLHEKIDTTTPMGRFVFRMMASLAELEREQIAERTSDAMRRRQADGQPMSSKPPFGKKIHWDGGNAKRLVDNPAELSVLNHIKRLLADGNRSHKIARILNEDGVACRGKRWYAGSIERILKNLQTP